MSKSNKKFELSTAQIIVSGFLAAIMLGSILLCLPVSSVDGTFTPFIDSLFTATTSVCVTGLVVVDTFAHWSFFGQIIILLLIQFGGLGIVSFTTFIMLILGKKVSLKDRMLLEDAFNLNTLTGLVKFLKKIIFGSLVVEAIGAVCYSFVFIPEFGAEKGIWASIFNAVSAFCNAGIDVIGNNSLANYVANPWINLVTMLLIILGGIGFIIWWDIIRAIRLVKSGDLLKKDFFRSLTLHTKITLTATFILIFGGALMIFALEFNNPATIGDLNFPEKILASFFQSVTTRTAGFFTFSQSGMYDSTSFICIVMMFIGGSSVGTAGGIKTSTISLILLTVISVIRGKKEVTAFRRSISHEVIRKALSVTMVSLILLFVSTLLLSLVSGGNFIDVSFETASALGTTGLSRDFTSSLNTFGKTIIIILMYFGRVGPISMAIAFNIKQKKGISILYPEENVTVG